MAMTRNQRRMAAKARLLAKSERIAKASTAAELEAKRRIVLNNLNAPRVRNFYPQSSMAAMPSQSHRGYVASQKLRLVVKAKA